METIATCKGLQLMRSDGEYFLVYSEDDEYIIHKSHKNTAHLIFNDYVAQAINGSELKINFDLEQK